MRRSVPVALFGLQRLEFVNSLAYVRTLLVRGAQLRRAPDIPGPPARLLRTGCAERPEEREMGDLRYPIGQHEWKRDPLPGERRAAIMQMAQTPHALRAAVAGLIDQERWAQLQDSQLPIEVSLV